jgi:hypothetical protein
MIDDLSNTLKAMLKRPGIPEPLASAVISFGRPVEGFKVEAPWTLNLFLYDIRENANLRTNLPIVERSNGNVLERRPPLRLACSYLVTAWAMDSKEASLLQEHKLLGQVFWALGEFAIIPKEFLQGNLRDQEPLPPLITAMIDPQKNFSEFWTALGNKLRPSLTVTATISMDLFKAETYHQIIAADTRISQDVTLKERITPESEEIKPPYVEQFVRPTGRVTDPNKAPVAEAIVTIVELGRRTKTDSEGRFVFQKGISTQKPGKYTLQVRKGAMRKDFEIEVPSPSGGYDVTFTDKVKK